MTSKILISKVPIKYEKLFNLPLFSHGYMQEPRYAHEVFMRHFRHLKKKDSFVCLEIGPGDSLFSCVISKCYGASKTYMVDVGEYATKDIEKYRKMENYLMDSVNCEKGSRSSKDSVREIINKYDGNYMTNGLESLKSIPTSSVDFVWSHAVLEHVYLNEFEEMIEQIRRVTKEEGVNSHRVDLRDHLSKSLNHLRFDKSFWESSMVKTSGFYTNRLRFPQIKNILQKNGFEIKKVNKNKWESMPIEKRKMKTPFKSMDKEDLLVRGVDIVAV